MIIDSTYVYWPLQCEQCKDRDICKDTNALLEYLNALEEVRKNHLISKSTKLQCKCDNFILGRNINGCEV